MTCRDMVHGLLMELDDHNCWTMAEGAGHRGPHRMQHFLSRARVDDQGILGAAADWAAGHLTAGQDDSDVVLIVDETGDAKSSTVGAARQYSGTLGGIALCQVAVTLTYASPAGHALIGCALYLPEDWAADEERRELAGVPDDVMFAARPELAAALLQQAHDRGIRAGFVAGDEVYGGRDLRYHPVFTDSPFELMAPAEAQHRDHAVVEQVFADWTAGPLAHLPSGSFAANAAWTACAAITCNLLRAAGCLASRFHARARGATIRAGLIDVAARLACGCRKPMPPGDIHESRSRRGHGAGPGSDPGRRRRRAAGAAARPA